METQQSHIIIAPVDDAHAASAVRLLVRFFAEEGFAGDEAAIASRLDALRRDSHHWAALALDEDRPVGIVTVTTMLYIEWGRVAEIGDLYVLPEQRGRGIVRELVGAAVTWSRCQDCSAVEVVITPEGEASHRLSRFYSTLGFAGTGRTISLMRLDGALG